jgi:sigma-B regulation protein RsbU (phosphoserine phosphatase)
LEHTVGKGENIPISSILNRNILDKLTALQNKFNTKELELGSLLEITQAINNNLPEDALYKIFNFTLRANLHIKKLVLYVHGEKWETKVQFGTQNNFSAIELPKHILKIQEPHKLDSVDGSEFNEFDLIIPVLHKDKKLAFLLTQGVGGENGQAGQASTIYLQAITNIIIVAIENKRLARRQLEEEAFRKELEIAKDVQKFLFPENLPYGVRLKIEASYLPHHTVGGDYYDYIPINQNQFLICIADVSGKGIPAAIIMSNFQASLRTLIRQTPNLSEIIEALNFQILEHAKGENFITFFAAIYDHHLKTMVYVNSGHNHPILYDKENGIRLLDEGSTVLGVFHPIPFINEGFITELENFLLFLYTDGVTEVSNEKGEEFGSDRLKEFILKNKDADLKEIHKLLISELERYKGKNNYNDDITILSCKMQGS